jgi:hypothetical protein
MNNKYEIGVWGTRGAGEGTKGEEVPEAAREAGSEEGALVAHEQRDDELLDFDGEALQTASEFLVRELLHFFVLRVATVGCVQWYSTPPGTPGFVAPLVFSSYFFFLLVEYFPQS